MSDRGNGPRTIVARGKIKVDARKAIAKLRDHLLVDLHLYGREIARVAVALGATRLDLTWDADDVVFTFDGRPLPAAAVVRARDHVLAPEAEGTDGAALRVLGIGVSAALGLDPRFVDVIIAERQTCTRIRFEPKHIDEDGAGDVPESTVIARPADLGAPAMRVHVRKKMRLGDLGRMVRADAPREVRLLAEVAHDAALTITTQGTRLQPLPDGTVLLRVDLDEPSLRRGALEVLAYAPGRTPRTSYLDLGVALTEGPALGVREGVASELPIRVLVDAERLPTNASRSEMRMDSELVQRVRARVPSAFAAALTALTGLVARGEESSGGLGVRVEVLERRREVLEHTVGAIAADVALLARTGATLTVEETALLALPLLQDAVGRPLALAAVRGGTPDHPLLVYTGAEAAPLELGAWLEGVIWARGRSAERAVAALTQVSANDRVAQAREGQERRRRALTHPPSRAVLGPSSAYVLKQSFDVGEGPFAGLRGEVAITPRGGPRSGSKARIFVDERLLEEVPLPGVELQLDMALSWPSALVPRVAYDGVERNEGLTRAVLYALRVAALAIGEQLGPRDPGLARLAIIASAGAARDLGDRCPASKAVGALARVAVWPTCDGRLVSLAALEDYALRTGAVCTAGAGAGAAIDGRPVLEIRHARALLGLLPPETVSVDYAEMLARSDESAQQALAAEASEVSVRVPIEREHVSGFVGIGPPGLHVLHRGVRRSDAPFAYRNGPVRVVIEDRAAVPHPAGHGLLWTSMGTAGYEREEDALLARVVDGCESGALDYAAHADYLHAAQRKVGERLASGRPTERCEELTAVHARLVGLPARIEQAALAHAKAEVLARPLHPSILVADRPATSSYDVPPSGHDPIATARITSASGTVTVALPRNAPGEPSPGEVLFKGHLVGRSQAEFPLAVVIDVARESLLDRFAALSEQGEAWARETAVLAALNLLEDRAKLDGFASDLDLLRLCESLLRDHVQLMARVALILRSARWPTVQGGLVPLGTTPMLHVGAATYAPYRAPEGKPSPYDAPAFHLPEGELGASRRRLLIAVGYVVTDATAEIARVQARRARGMDSPPPQLPGTPAHLALRATLTELGATLAEGEIEIHKEPRVAAARVDDTGVATPTPLFLTQPVRVVFRANDVESGALTAEIAAATARLLRSLAPSVDRLPPFVRGRVRALICEAVSRGEQQPADDDASVFEDVRGYPWSLAQLREATARRRTGDPPPWPADLGGHEAAAVVHLTNAEAAALKKLVTFEDVTKELRDRRTGELRRAAPPRATLALPDEMRANCILTFPLEEDGMRGEVGLLRPASWGMRAIAVFTTMRHVRNIHDKDGWPTVAMVDVDDLATTPAFDAVATRSDLDRIQRRVRLSALTRAGASLKAPLNTVGVVRLPVPFLARRSTSSGRAGKAEPPITCVGVFWMERTWPDSPSVQVEWRDGTDAFRIPRVRTGAGMQHGVLPITGRLFVDCSTAHLDEALTAVFELVLERLSPILAAAAGAKRASAEELAAYTWDLRLLGARQDVSPVAEMAKDRPDPVLMRVASRRAPSLIDRATGDAPAPPAAPARAPVHVAVPPPPAAPAPVTAVAEEPPALDFFAGLVRKVVELVRPARLEVPPETPLTRALLERLLALRLTGEPVERVLKTNRGRAVRYEAKRKAILLNVTHEAVRAAAAPPRIVLLLVAAVSEINRELVPVTDAEELAVLVELLRDGA